jgi:predicted ATPase/DNA-binding SARP family transcriptional activator
MRLYVAILGSVELRVDGRPMAIAAGKQRALLALLALRAPEPISADAAADELWPAAAPPQSLRTLQVTVSRLRRSMGAAADALETLPSGYRLALEDEAIDAHRCERLMREGARARAGGELRVARRFLDEALALWRGPALADVAFEPFAQGEIARLEELRLTALEERTDVLLELGEHQLAVGDLKDIATRHPDRERLLRQLMLALYRCGRQPEALAAYQRARRRLADELGLEPSVELRRLESAILRQDASLDVDAQPDESSGPTETTMPSPPTVTVGRDGDLGAIRALLEGDEARLVTLTGPGGVGKTRLAIELARSVVGRFDAGDAFVSLAEIADPEAVPSAIARALTVTRLEEETLEQALERTLGGPRRLLVIDNFEQVATAASVLAALHAACPRLTMVVTSREPLRLRAEHVYRVEPLSTPVHDASPEELEASPAGELFLAQARARRPLPLDDDAAAAIAAMCRRLDGLPLALELAAGSLGLLSPRQLADRLGDSVATLTRGPRDAPARQRTLAATIDWSVELLDEAERLAFTRFAVFPGGATLDAAQTVTQADLDVLDGLVDRNLLRTVADPDDAPRLSMLVTVREAALARLAGAADRDDVAARHARWYLDLAEASETGLPGIESGKWMRRVAAEMPNFQTAIEWGLDNDHELALRIAAALGEYWTRLASTDGERLLQATLARAGDRVPVALRARALLALSRVYSMEPERTEGAAIKSLELFESIGDDRGAAAALAHLSHCAGMNREDERGVRCAEEALARARRAGDGALVSEALTLLTVFHKDVDDMLRAGEAAEGLLVEHGRIDRQAQLLMSMGYECLHRGAAATARPLMRRALAIAERRDNPILLAGAWGNEALAALFAGDEAAAETAFRTELWMASELRAAALVCEAVHGLGALAASRHDDELGAVLRGAGGAIYRHRPDPVLDDGLEWWFAPCRERLGDDRWNELVLQGAGMSMEEAVALAAGDNPINAPT